MKKFTIAICLVTSILMLAGFYFMSNNIEILKFYLYSLGWITIVFIVLYFMTKIENFGQAIIEFNKKDGEGIIDRTLDTAKKVYDMTQFTLSQQEKIIIMFEAQGKKVLDDLEVLGKKIHEDIEDKHMESLKKEEK